MPLASLGIDFGVPFAINLWVAAVLPAPDGQLQLCDIVYHEDRPDLGVVKLVSRKTARAVPKGATKLFVPWTNYDRMDSLWLWRGWIDGANLCGLPQPSDPLLRIPLGAEPSQLIRPALSTTTGEMDVPLIGAGGKELLLARFLPGREGQAASGSVLWRIPIAEPPVASRAALGPAASGSQRRLVLMLQKENGVTLHLLDITGGRKPASTVTIDIPKVFALPNSEPGIRIDDKGATHISVLLSSGPDFKDLSTADVSFPPGGGPPALSPKIVNVRSKLDAPPVAAGITYEARPDRPMRRDWVVLLADGTLVHSQSNDKPMRPRGVPVTPLDLVAMSRATYILTIQADGPNLEALH